MVARKERPEEDFWKLVRRETSKEKERIGWRVATFLELQHVLALGKSPSRWKPSLAVSV